MKVVINNENTNNKTLIYQEGFWTGKRTISYDGTPLTKVKRNIFEYKTEKTTENFEIKGNQLIGVTINMLGKDVGVSHKLTWYEIVLSILVFIPCILFGAVGGAVGGALGFTNIMIIRSLDKTWVKIVVSVEFIAISLLLSYVLAVLVFKALTLVGL